ncbi:MAG: FKBP-type peptidyl-prolyl cis-trans isomerase [Saprospiraceae bacterium]|nr:FKBP-type peptidyl-prolyl cis-trans isomerase [Saprospiraceae bacterium]
MNFKNVKITGICCALFLSLSSISLAQEISNKLDSVSYSVGVLFAKNIKQQGVKELNAEVVAKAINDYMNGETRVIPENECQAMYMSYMKRINEEKTAGAKLSGVAYLAENKEKEGVMVTASGLQYEVITSGTGPKPTASDKVRTHYHGMLIDGTVFDSSVDRGEPISFQVGGVIKGWQEALQLMSVGDKWRLVIPSELAYGSRGAGAKIPPHSTLVFEVELLGIE